MNLVQSLVCSVAERLFYHIEAEEKRHMDPREVKHRECGSPPEGSTGPQVMEDQAPKERFLIETIVEEGAEQKPGPVWN